VPTVVSSGGGGHVQHVSVVGHVQHVTGPYDSAMAMSGSDSDELTAKKKASSFKITNVYVSRPPSNDGDDSCDDLEDLEDSHTEDLSEIADSLSSQLETIAAHNSGLVHAPGLNGPQLPGGLSPAARNKQSSAHAQSSNAGGLRRQSTDRDWDQVYPHGGFGFVTYQHTGDTFHPVSYLDKAVSGAVAVFNSMEFGTELNSSNAPVVGPQDFKTKFKVVKVDTTQPLKRGRWTCIDFSDKSTSSASEVSKNAAASSGTGSSSTVAQNSGTSKTTTSTKASDLVPNSRPGSTLPREPSETSTVINSDNSDVVPSAAPVKIDQEPMETFTGGAIEDKDTEAPAKVEIRATSAGPEGGQGGAYPGGPSYPSSSASSTSTTTATSSTSSNLNINLPSQQSVPVITPTPSVQSPHTGGQMPDYNTLQGTIGQVIRLNDGTLAQVALAPLPQQQQQVVKILPNSTNQPMVPQHQQQMVVNAQTQHYLVQQQQQQQQQQQNLNAVSQQQQQQQSNRSQIPQQQQPQQSATQQQQQQPPPQQQQSSRSQQQNNVQQQSIPSQPTQQQQPQQRSQQQNSVQQPQPTAVQQQPQQQQPTQTIPTNQGVITNASALPMQQQPPPQPQQSAVVSQQQPVATGGQPAVVSAPAGQPVQPVKRQSATGGPTPVTAAPPVGQSRPAVSQPSAVQPVVCQNGVASLPAVNTSVTSLAPTVVSHPNFYNFVSPPQSVFSVNPSLDSGYSATVNSLIVSDSEALVERLEDLVSHQLSEETREGELLELESASGSGQGSIDHRIEQAMDLVKSHLMTAVRSEVEELRDKISKLEDTVNHLSRENEVLRANVNPEVLTSLLGNRSILGSLPPAPDPTSHPALQPPNQH